MKHLSIYVLLHPFHNASLSSIVHINIVVSESRNIYVFRFINIYMNVGNARKSQVILNPMTRMVSITLNKLPPRMKNDMASE